MGNASMWNTIIPGSIVGLTADSISSIGSYVNVWYVYII